MRGCAQQTPTGEPCRAPGRNRKAADMLRTSCQPGDAISRPARLAAVGKRLDTCSSSQVVRSALDDFYGSLSDEQKRNSRR